MAWLDPPPDVRLTLLLTVDQSDQPPVRLTGTVTRATISPTSAGRDWESLEVEGLLPAADSARATEVALALAVLAGDPVAAAVLADRVLEAYHATHPVRR